MALCYNFTRVLNILGFESFIARIIEVLLSTQNSFQSSWTVFSSRWMYHSDISFRGSLKDSVPPATGWLGGGLNSALLAVRVACVDISGSPQLIRPLQAHSPNSRS